MKVKRNITVELLSITDKKTLEETYIIEGHSMPKNTYQPLSEDMLMVSTDVYRRIRKIINLSKEDLQGVKLWIDYKDEF